MSATLATMTAAQLARAIDKASALSSALCDEMIAAGRGHETSWETRKLADPLAVRVNAASNALCDLHSERSARREYHGTDRPIRRATFA